jgi:hypothetical protein
VVIDPRLSFDYLRAHGSLNDGEDFVEVPTSSFHNRSVENLLEYTQPRLREGNFDAESAVLTKEQSAYSSDKSSQSRIQNEDSTS